jgi:hypothetical protein
LSKIIDFTDISKDKAETDLFLLNVQYLGLEKLLREMGEIKRTDKNRTESKMQREENGIG